MILYKSLTYLIEDELHQAEHALCMHRDVLFKKPEVKKEENAIFSSESVFKRIIEFVQFLRKKTQEDTSYSLEKIHLDWINDILCDLLYILEPADFIKRAALAAKFDIENYDKWAFAYWPRRTGKSFINGIIFVSVLMGKPLGSMVVQSINMKSAYETILPFRSHIQNLFDYFGVKEIDPIRMFGQNGVRFINWYGAQEILSGRHTSNNLPAHCFSSIQIISGSEDAGRGITKDIYLMDEAEFMRNGSKRNFLMNTKRKGTIMVAISSENTKVKNPRVEKMKELSDIATVSVYQSICAVCARKGITDCPHQSEPAWLSDSKDLQRVSEHFLENQRMNMLEQFGGSALFTGNAFKVPEYKRLDEFYFDKPVRPIECIICAIDPALSDRAGASEFASYILGMTEYHINMDDQQFNYIYVLDALYQNKGTSDERVASVVEQVFEFRRKNKDYVDLPIIFVPENNQKALPEELNKHLLLRAPYLCNWYIYGKKKDFAMAANLGICSTEDTKQTAANHLQVYLQNKRFKFSRNVPISMVEKLMIEIENVQQKLDITGANAVPVISAKQGYHDDGLMCIFMAIIAYVNLAVTLSVQVGTYNNLTRSRPCDNCTRHASGHFDPVRKRERSVGDFEESPRKKSKVSEPVKKRGRNDEEEDGRMLKKR